MTPSQSKIKAFLEVQDISPEIIAESKKAFELEAGQKAIQRHFTEGKCYKIWGSGCLVLTTEKPLFTVFLGSLTAPSGFCGKMAFTIYSEKSGADGQEHIQTLN